MTKKCNFCCNIVNTFFVYAECLQMFAVSAPFELLLNFPEILSGKLEPAYGQAPHPDNVHSYILLENVWILQPLLGTLEKIFWHRSVVPNMKYNWTSLVIYASFVFIDHYFKTETYETVSNVWFIWCSCRINKERAAETDRCRSADLSLFVNIGYHNNKLFWCLSYLLSMFALGLRHYNFTMVSTVL